MNLSFVEILQQYKLMIEQVYNAFIRNLYSKFDFLYLISDEKEKYTNHIVENHDIIEKYLVNYFSNFKFMTIHFCCLYDDLSVSEKIRNITISNIDSRIDVILCVENKCHIIENINFLLIKKIIYKLKDQQISIINTNTNVGNLIKSDEKNKIKEEIDNFCADFYEQINENNLIKNTIRPIAGYIIRRNFYPTSYFKDPSFFNFNESREIIGYNLLLDAFKISNITGNTDKFIETINEIEKSIDNNKINIQDFQINDFIILRKLYSNTKAFFYLVIHIESLSIFLMKKIPKDIDIETMEHEIHFCSNYSHRCMVPFYGFLKEKNKKIGFIYEFMANGSLDNLISSNEENVSELYALMATNRIFQGIEYLYSNKLIHRDLKPSNILINHDFLPFISDFETIRHSSEEEESVTKDFGSQLYSSPEQGSGKSVSYPTDVYSFGLIIYFLFEKKNMYSNVPIVFIKSPKDEIPSMTKASNNIENLYKSCVKFYAKDRPSIKKIKSTLKKEINSFHYFEQVLLNNSNIAEVFPFIHEIIAFQHKKNDKSNNSLENEIYLNDNNKKNFPLDEHFLEENINEDNEIYLNDNIEKCFPLDEHFVEENINEDSDDCLNDFYENNYPPDLKFLEEYIDSDIWHLLDTFDEDNNNKNTEQPDKLVQNKSDYNDEEEDCSYDEFDHDLLLNSYSTNIYSFYELFYIKVKENNNSILLYSLGEKYFIYKDYKKAREFFELASKSDNSDAFLKLGILYDKGYGVDIDYIKAKGYFESAAELNNARAFVELGEFYENAKSIMN